MDKYSASINCAYTDDGDNISVSFKYKDSNGVDMVSNRIGSDIDEITGSIIKDIAKSMKAAAEKAAKPKKPEEMTKEELLEALKLMEKEANSQRTRNEMLEKRLKAQDKAANAKKPSANDRPAQTKKNTMGSQDEFDRLIRLFTTY